MGFGLAAAEVADAWPLMAVWRALFPEGGVLTREDLFRRPAKPPLSSAPVLRPGEEIAVAALSPNPMASFWWAPKVCRAARRSPLLSSFRATVSAELDAHATQAWDAWGDRVLSRARGRHWPGESSPPPPPGRAREWLGRGRLVVVVDRAKARGRRVGNEAELWKGLVKALGRGPAGRPILKLSTDSNMPYLIQ